MWLHFYLFFIATPLLFTCRWTGWLETSSDGCCLRASSSKSVFALQHAHHCIMCKIPKMVSPMQHVLACIGKAQSWMVVIINHSHCNS